MFKFKFFLLLFFISFSTFAQEIKTPIKNEIADKENDSILNDTILLEEVHIYKEKLDPEAKKQFLILQNRVYKVYPFAKTASDRLSMLNANMEKLKSNKEKKRYFKIAEDYLQNEFTDQLKKLSRKQGQILVKLIHRQTGITTFNLIKDYKSGWKAFWSNNTARLFNINLKEEYKPYDVNEDFLIETILYRAFVNGRLAEQKPATIIDIDELTTHWEKLAAELKKNK